VVTFQSVVNLNIKTANPTKEGVLLYFKVNGPNHEKPIPGLVGVFKIGICKSDGLIFAPLLRPAAVLGDL
jgi:hypothetical protein